MGVHDNMKKDICFIQNRCEKISKNVDNPDSLSKFVEMLSDIRIMEDCIDRLKLSANIEKYYIEEANKK